MIEYSFSSSSWDLDPFQGLGAEIPFTEFDNCIESLERNCSDLSSFTALNDLSCSSSDPDDALVFADLDNILPVTDSFISQILEESNSIDDWSLLEDTENRNLPVESDLACARDSPKKAKNSSNYLTNKSWSKMSPEEQMNTLHALSDIVTCGMGIREQIEVIKIIDPTVKISPDDKEFALDISCLNDTKMKRIRDYVQKVGFSVSSSSKKFNSSSKSGFASEKPRSNKIVSRKINSRTKRRQKKQKPYTDEDIRQKRKLELHGQKEMRSGLFVYEKVIKKLSNPLEEDEDVNILE